MSLQIRGSEKLVLLLAKGLLGILWSEMFRRLTGWKGLEHVASGVRTFHTDKILLTPIPRIRTLSWPLGYKRSLIIPAGFSAEALPGAHYWVAVKELNLGYYIWDTILISLYTPIWQLNLNSLTATQTTSGILQTLEIRAAC